MGKLDGKKCLITGGTSGIGLSTAKLFIEEGAKVAVIGRNQDSLENANNILGRETLCIKVDVSSLYDLDQMVKEIKDKFGSVDVLFTNAGITKPCVLTNINEEIYNEHFDINFKGALFTIQKTVPIMNDNGSIVLNTSISNQLGFPGTILYTATKAALRSLARTISAELLDRGIRVNAVSPGTIETPLASKTGLPEEVVKERMEHYISLTPMKRIGKPEEIAKAVLFLASDDSSYMLGEEIIVDGGCINL